MQTFNFVDCARRTGKSTAAAQIFADCLDLLQHNGYHVKRRGSNGCIVTAGWPTSSSNFSIVTAKCKNTKTDLQSTFDACRNKLRAETSPDTDSGPVQLTFTYKYPE